MASRNEDGTPGSLRKLPLYRQLQSLIGDYIKENDLRPGDPLPPEGELAVRWGVSRNSLREAVKSLQVLGLIDSRPGTGLFVREFSFDPLVEQLPYAILLDSRDLSDLLEVRQILEVQMAERIVKRRTRAQLERLGGIVTAWQDEIKADRAAYPAGLDRAFHEALVSEISNGLMSKLLDVFWQAFNRASTMEHLVMPRNPSTTFARHLPIVEAIRAGDSGALRSSLTAHYRGISRRVNAAEKSRLGERPSDGLRRASPRGSALRP